ncbi:hypothetical protein [Geomonas sp. Red276]
MNKGIPSGQFQITNTGEEVERYRVKMVYFTFGPDGTFRELPHDEHSLAQWMKFNPKEFAIPPKSRQAVRFYIPSHGKLRDGEYWAAMQLESLKTTEARASDDRGRNFRFQVIPSILVPIFATFGEVRYMGVMKDTKIVSRGNQHGLETVIVNTGQGRLFVEGEYELLGESGEVEAKGPLGRAYVMPNSERVILGEIKEPISDGMHTLRVIYRSSQLKQPLFEEIRLHQGASI